MRRLFPILLLFIFLPFQACNSKIAFISTDVTSLKSDMNGEGYGGKPTPFDFLDPKIKCADIGANGSPLPNSQIFVFPNGSVQLVRENCSDIPPRTLASNEYTIAANGDIIYQNHSFSPNLNPTPFDVVAASCPAGKTQLPNAVRTSLMREPLDLLAAMWEHTGLAVSLEGSLASLPVFKVQRHDPASLESWHRMAQSAIMESNQGYVFSFYVKPDPSEKVMFTSFYPNVQDFRAEFDLVTGAATIISTTGVSQVSSKATPFAGGLYINIYFQSQSDVHANIGMASSGNFLGSSVSTTALQLEKVSDFCSP